MTTEKTPVITEKQLLAMKEDDYMNEVQLAFFRSACRKWKRNFWPTQVKQRSTYVKPWWSPTPQTAPPLKKSMRLSFVPAIVNASC